MAIRKWLSRKGHDAGNVPVRRHEAHPLISLQNEINRAFDDFFGFSLMPSRLMPEAQIRPN